MNSAPHAPTKKKKKSKGSRGSQQTREQDAEVEGFIVPDLVENKVMAFPNTQMFCCYCKKKFMISTIFNHMKRLCNENQEITQEQRDHTAEVNARCAKVAMFNARKKSDNIKYTKKIMKMPSTHKKRDNFFGRIFNLLFIDHLLFLELESTKEHTKVEKSNQGS